MKKKSIRITISVKLYHTNNNKTKVNCYNCHWNFRFHKTTISQMVRLFLYVLWEEWENLLDLGGRTGYPSPWTTLSILQEGFVRTINTKTIVTKPLKTDFFTKIKNNISKKKRKKINIWNLKLEYILYIYILKYFTSELKKKNSEFPNTKSRM